MLSIPYHGHESISIEGNGDFDSAHGVKQGIGTAQDPFVIQNITISKGKGLSIANTDAYVVIRNMTLDRLTESDSGVTLRYSKNVLFEDLKIANSSAGLYLDHAENCSLVRCEIGIVRSGQSVSFYDSRDCKLSESRVSQPVYTNVAGSVVLGNSIGCEISDNTIINCHQGIYVADSESCVITGNFIRSDYYGISIDSSINMSVARNDLGTNAFTLGGLAKEHFTTHTIAEDNLVNGLPLLYLSEMSGVEIRNRSIGQLIAVYCSNISVANLSFDAGTHQCVLLVNCSHGMVENIRVSGGNVDWSNSSYYSIYSYHLGVQTLNCEDFTVTSCTISTVTTGLLLGGTNLRATSNNIVNSECGISCRGSNLTISNNTLLHNRQGIYVHGGILGITDRVWILDNNISGVHVGNQIGITVSESSNVTIRLNKIADNNWGVRLEGYYYRANGISVYQNDFIRNFYQAIIEAGNVSALWNTDYPTGGNYWSDYSGTDDAQGVDQTAPGPDGIGDSPYHVFTGTLPFGDVDFWDEYPLMSPCTN